MHTAPQNPQNQGGHPAGHRQATGGGAFAPPPVATPEVPEEPTPDPEPEDRSIGERLKERFSRDLRDAMIDHEDVPSGDFDIVAQQVGATSTDRVASFSSLITAMRLATVAISMLVAASSEDFTTSMRLWTAVIIAYAVFRSFKPVRYSDDFQSVVRVIGEVALHVVAVIYTGGWDSPLVFTLLTPVALAGLARGFGFSLRVGITAIIAVTWPFVVRADDSREALLTSASWGVIVLIVAVIAGYARRISGEADRERELALDRLSRLSDANTLLFSLHRVTQTLPASLDLDDVLDSTLSRMKSLVSYDSVAVLLFDETDGQWAVVRHHGLHAPRRLAPMDLSAGLRKALAESRPIYLPNVPSEGGGLNERAGSGIYTVMPARGSIIGMLAIEHTDLEHFTARDLELVEGFVAPASLAVDNARWFARLRTVGADEERTRIARDLHDRIGQSLAYLAFELDRIVERDSHGDPVTAEVTQLRDDVRNVIREVRDTLYDLRTDVSDSLSLADVLAQYVERVSERSGLQIHTDTDTHARLPLLQEREMWRVAQEALANAERHADATAVRIVWRCDGQRAVMDVTDNGKGFEAGKAGRLDSYGMLGMRERAASIGASLEVVSAPGRGTRVRCVLDPDKAPPNDSPGSNLTQTDTARAIEAPVTDVATAGS